MVALVLDASVALAFLLPGEKGYQLAREIIASMRGSDGVVPGLWVTEVAKGLLIAERKGRISSEDADRLLLTATGLLDRSLTVATVHRHLFYNVHHIGRMSGLTAYGAAYLELAVQHSLPLATFDTALRRAARDPVHDIRVLPESV